MGGIRIGPGAGAPPGAAGPFGAFEAPPLWASAVADDIMANARAHAVTAIEFRAIVLLSCSREEGQLNRPITLT